MTEEEKMKFWGELVEPIVALLGGLPIVTGKQIGRASCRERVYVLV